MKILLDECVDVEFRRHVVGHDVFTVAYMGWKGLKNGELLATAASAGFEVLVTTDRGVQYQQHLSALRMSVIVIAAASNRFRDLQPFLPDLLKSLNHIQPGTVAELTH